MTTGAACDPDDPDIELEDWPNDLLALVREGLALSPKSLGAVSRALLGAVEQRFAEGRADDPAPLVVRIAADDVGAGDALDRVVAFTERVHALPTARRPVFSMVLRDAATMLEWHRQVHRAAVEPGCPFCAGLLPVGPDEAAS